MTDDRNQDEITQPVPITLPKMVPAESSILKENEINTVADIPAWLLEFASKPTAELPEEQELETTLTTLDDQAEDVSIPPISLETAEWQPVQAEIETIEPEQIETIIDPMIAADDLLAKKDYTAFADQIRNLSLTELAKQELKAKLRSHLTLSEDASVLWDVYDSLNKS